MATLFLINSFKLHPTQAATSNKKSLSGDITITNTSNDFNGSLNIYEINNGNLTIKNDLNNSTEKRTLVVFVDKTLTINTNILHPDVNSGLVFVVKGNVNIDKTVTQIDAVIIAQGTIYTAAASGSTCTVSSVPATPLTINGSLVSLDPDNPIIFCRSLTDNSQPAEKINHQVKYLVILRDLLSDTYQKWSEIP